MKRAGCDVMTGHGCVDRRDPKRKKGVMWCWYAAPYECNGSVRVCRFRLV
jgi:hypothetical protein